MRVAQYKTSLTSPLVQNNTKKNLYDQSEQNLYYMKGLNGLFSVCAKIFIILQTSRILHISARQTVCTLLKPMQIYICSPKTCGSKAIVKRAKLHCLRLFWINLIEAKPLLDSKRQIVDACVLDLGVVLWAFVNCLCFRALLFVIFFVFVFMGIIVCDFYVLVLMGIIVFL